MRNTIGPTFQDILNPKSKWKKKENLFSKIQQHRGFTVWVWALWAKAGWAKGASLAWSSSPISKLKLKGTVPWDFLPLVFFVSLFLLGPVDTPRNEFDFFRLFAEIFDHFAASPASTTPAMHALPVSLTPVSNSSPVSMTPVSDTCTVLESFTGVNDTGKKLLTGVIDTGNACIRRCQWHLQSMYSPVSMTPAKHVTSVIDTGDVMHHRCHWYRAVKTANYAGVNDTAEACLRRCQWHRQCMHCRCRWHRWCTSTTFDTSPMLLKEQSVKKTSHQ